MSDIEALAERLEKLETTVAFQEATIEELNGVVTSQWKEIETLQRQVTRLTDQLRDVATHPALAESEAPPPHY